MKPLKHNLPTLATYKGKLPEKYWNAFPFRKIPERPTTRIMVDKLERLVEKRKEYMTIAEVSRARKVIKNLKMGAPSYQKKNLPSLYCVNDESSYENGEVLSDNIADWVVGEFVAGPFKYPPVQDFRTNPLKVIIQHGKARMVVNASAPMGRSFNDNVDEGKLEKIEMSSACRFGQSVLKA